MIYVGVDGGGTKTKLALFQDETLIKEVVVGPSSIDTVTLDVSNNNVTQGLELLYKDLDLPKIDKMFLGLGGIAGQKHIDDVIEITKTLPFFHVNSIIGAGNDINNAYKASCSGRNNITLIVGTGAVAYGIDEEGKRYRTNGIHYLEGDFGSAYDLGARLMKYVTKAWDERIEKTPLVEAILQKENITDMISLIDFLNEKRMDRTYIAQYAKYVTEYALKGDKYALEIIDQATDEMMLSIIAVDKKINLQNREIGIIGSLGAASPYFETLERKIKEYDKRFIVHPSELDPVLGSVLMAKSL